MIGNFMNEPLITVIVPVYNGESFLADALDSILSQSYQPVELIVVDDGSTDRTAEVAQRFLPSITLVPQPNSGHASARNCGLDHAKGDLFAFLDADDLWIDRDKLRIQADALAADPDIDMVFGHMIQFRSEQWRGPGAPPTSVCSPPQPAAVSCNILVRRPSFQRVGRFNEQLRIGVFMDWYLRARDVGLRELVLPNVFLARRVHGGNIGIRERANRNTYVKVLKAALDRRRSHKEGAASS